MPEFDADVLIVGGGPVGLVTAMDLDARGVSTIVIEQRAFLEPPSVKANHVSSRTMEAFRRLGIADVVRNAGLPSDHPQDVVFRTSMVGTEFARIPIPSRAGRSIGTTDGPDTTWATPEPPHRVNQRYVEPILERHVESLRNVELRNEVRCESVRQDADGVTAVVRHDGEAEPRTIRARYLVGADGGSSLVRKAIGAKLHGDPVLQQVQSTCISAPGLYDLMQADPAWGYYTFNAGRSGHVYAIDGRETFLVHTYLTDEEAEHGSVDRDRAIRDILGIDDAFEYEVISQEDWTARRLVADRFRDRRMFIAGDAAHLWVPMGGYGMNAGIADGLNLAWVLGAVLSGWADESILDAYVAERQPITEQVSRFAMSHLRKIDVTDIPGDLGEPTPAGEQARADFGRLAYELNVQQFAAEGLNFGYSYATSPIIVHDGEEPPAYTMGTYTPSTVPGCRVPHVWVGEDISLYDRLGPWYTLLVTQDDGGAGAAWAEDVTHAGVPTESVSLDGVELPAAYVRRYVLVRQDQHVVWRGDDLPEDHAVFARRLGGRRDAASKVSASYVAAAAPPAA